MSSGRPLESLQHRTSHSCAQTSPGSHSFFLFPARRLRYSSSTAVEPKAKANSLLAALPGNSLVSKTGIVTLTAALSAAAVSNEIFVANEEVVILGAFIVFASYVATLIRAPYAEWADGQIKVRSPRARRRLPPPPASPFSLVGFWV